MKLWRGLWSFRLADEEKLVNGEVISYLVADYLCRAGDKIVVISKLIYRADEHYILQWFEHIRHSLSILGSSIRDSIFTTSPEEYMKQLIQLYREWGSEFKAYVLSDKKKLLMCDLGDVIWDECPAQAHMRNIAMKVLLEKGWNITQQQWNEAYFHVAEKSSGDRFYHCVSNFTDEVGVQFVREAINCDFLTMSDSDYIAFHPLREKIWESFVDIYHEYEICFVANQPTKAYRLLQEYYIGLISPVWFLSCEVGIKKPDPGIFRLSLERMSYGRSHYSECIMIGNRKDMDLIPSEKVGAKGILFLCKNSPVSEQEIHREYVPWKTVDSIEKLREILLDNG